MCRPRYPPNVAQTSVQVFRRKTPKPGQKPEPPELLRTIRVTYEGVSERCDAAIQAAKEGAAAIGGVSIDRVTVNHRAPSGFVAHIVPARA